MLPALRASVSHSPLAGQSQTVCAPEGASLADLVALAFPDVILRRFVVAFIDGEEVAPAAWANFTPRAGAFINLCIRPGDGDSDAGKILRTVLTIAVIAAAAWVGAAQFVSFFGVPIAPSLAAATTAVVGNLLINALVPIAPQQSRGESPAPYYTVTGARNAARLNSPVPLLLGRHRFFPPLYGQYVQETVGNDVYLRVPFCLGPAPMQVSDLKIGDTLLSSYAGVEVEQRLNASDPAHSLYTGDPQQDTVGATITTTYTVRNSVADADEIDIVIAFPGGLGGYDSKNRKVERTVTFDVRYRPAGSTEAWQTLRPIVSRANQAAINAGASSRAGYFGVRSTLAEYATELVAFGDVDFASYPVTRADPGRGFQEVIRLVVPRNSAGYEVGVRRNAVASNDPSVVDAASWAIIGSRKTYVNPFPDPGLASIVLRIKASEQLSGVIDTFNCIAEPKIPLFSSAAKATPSGATAASLTTVGVSRNPAELVLNLYRGPQASRPRPDARIDWPAWAEFATFCEDNDLHYDEVIEGPIARGELARRICAAAFARPIRWGGKLSVVIDRDRGSEAPAQVFTPRNVSNLRWRKSFPADTHAVRIAFNNAANGYQADETTLYLDGFNASNATKIETLPVAGKTDADEVRVVGRQYVNNSLRQTETFTFDMDSEALTCRPGAYAVLLHDAIGVGLGSARVKSLVMSGANVAGFILDVGVATDVGDTLAARWRKEDGAGGFTVATEAGVSRDATDPAKFTFPSPVTTANAPGVDDVVLIGRSLEVSLPVLVRDVSWDFGQRASVTVIPYAAERFVPDGTPLPPHTPMVTLPIAARPATPTSLSAVATARDIALSFFYAGSPRGVTLTGFETAVRETGNAADSWQDRGPLPAAARVFVAPPGNPGYSYDLRVVAVGQDSGGLPVKSDPLIVTGVAAATVPPSPTGCAAAFATRTSSGGASQVILSALWTINEDPDVLDTVIEWRTSTGPDVWKEIGRARAALGNLEVHGLQVGRTYDLRFVHLSRRGIASTPTTISTITAPDTLGSTAASSAPWTGVTSRPANLSALGGTEPIQNALVAQGPNALRQSEFRVAGYYFVQGTPTPVITYGSTSQLRRAILTTTGTVASTVTASLTAAANNLLPCQPGDRIEASAYLGATVWPVGYMNVFWYDAAGAFLTSSAVQGLTTLIGFSGSGSLTTYKRFGGFVTAPASACAAALVCGFGNNTGGNITSPVGYVTQPLIRKADATQTALSPWAPGFEGVPGADITIANTAAGITGQGDLATANRASLPFGVNGLVDTNFGWQSTYYAKDSVTGTTTFSTSTSTGGLKKGGVTGAGLTVNGANYIRHHSIQQDAFFPCKPGDVIGARALIGTTNTSSIQLLIAFRDAAGTATGFSTATVLSTGLLAGGGEETTFNELTNVATAPAGTVTANIDIRAIASTAAPVLVVAKPMLALMQSGQTAVPAYSPGREHQIGADVTLSNTAAGITGQGTLATVSRPNVVSLTGTETLDNALIAQGANGVIDSGFRTPSLHWSLAGFLNTPTISYLAESQIRKARITGAASVPNTGTAQLSGQSGNAVPCVSGDRIEASAYFGAAASGWSSGQVYVDWYNASNTYLSSTFIGSATMSGALGNGDLSTFARVAGFATAPANTALARLSQRFVNASGGALTSPVGSTCLPLLRRADATQTAASLWSPGLDAVPGADITSANTAAGIAGQGDLATTNRASLPFGANVAANSDFANGAAYPPLGWTGGIGDTTGATLTGSIVTAGARRTLKVVLAGTTTGGTYFDAAYMPQSSLPLLQRWTLPVVAGDVVGGSALIAKNAAVSVALAIVCWYDASGAFLSQSNGNSVSASANGDTGNPADYTLSSVAATAPTNARFAILFVRGLASTGAVNATVWTMSPLLCRLPAGQTVVPAYSPGPTDRLADQTAANTASAIMAQGTQATANAQRGSTYSGTPVEGSWWADTSTTPNKLKFYTGGAWQVVATLVSDAAANALSVSFSPASVNTTHTTNTPLSQAVTATVTGGSGTYTYVWAVGDVFSGSAPTLTNQYTATCTVNVAHSAIATIDGAISCTITDTVTGKSIVRYWGYYSQGTGGGGGAGGGGGLPP